MSAYNINVQQNISNLLKNSIEQNRLGHAYILHGPMGRGLFPVALQFAQDIFYQENPNAIDKVQHLQHLDLHFSFPVISSENSNPNTSDTYMKDWIAMIRENPFADYAIWSEIIKAEKKQMNFSVAEIKRILEKFSVKSFENGHKILIIWNAQLCKPDTWNYLLKFIEEPAEKTVLIILTESLESIIDTVKSRCQQIHVPKINTDTLLSEIQKHQDIDPEKAKEIAFSCQGDWNKMISKLSQTDDVEFDEMFVKWVRVAFLVKKNPEKLIDINDWCNIITKWNRDKQIAFLDFCSQIFRLALMQNYGLKDLVYEKIKLDDFKWEVFSSHIHGKNIPKILEEISLADLHIKRNGNAAIVWMDLGIKLSRMMHLKAN